MSASAEKHGVWEDAQAFVMGTAMCALGLAFITHMGLVTGQTAGLAVLISYLTGWSFGVVFFAVNLPFYWLAWRRMGVRFTIKSFIAVSLLSVFTEVQPMVFSIDHVQPVVGALLLGGCIGLGLIVLFRHGASLGGIGVLGLYLQEKTGFRAGWTQLIFDGCLFTVAMFVLDIELVVLSLIGAVVANVIIGVNHRKDRYIAT